MASGRRTARQTLSVCLVTNASAERLRACLTPVRDYADEVVVTLDATAGEEARAAASELCDSLAVADLGGMAESARGWTAERARGDWILAIDDDELMAPGFADALPGLLAGSCSHYHLPVRWIVPGEAGGPPQWLRQFPWYPNQATRLFRNVSGGFRHPARLHSVWEVAGDGCSLYDADVAIYHLNLLLLGREERERKIQSRYGPLAGVAMPTCEEYYLYEDYAETLELAPVPDEVAAQLAAAPARAEPSHAPAPALRVTAGELSGYLDDRSGEPPIWSAQYLAHTTPQRLFTNRGCAVQVSVRNTSRATWGTSGTVAGRVVLSYRWRSLGGELVVPQGDIALLPGPCRPGDEATVLAGLWTPREPGRYLLQWEMLCERVAWFSDHGVEPLSVEVEIEDRGVRPRAPHFPEPVPAAAPKPRSALSLLGRRWQAS